MSDLVIRVDRKVALVAAFVLPTALFAAVPHTFTNGTVADADLVNANFTALDAAITAAADDCGTSFVRVDSALTGSFCIQETAQSQTNAWAAQNACQSRTGHICGLNEYEAAYEAGVITQPGDAQGEWGGFIGHYPGTVGDGARCTGPTMWSYTFDAAGNGTLALDCVDADRTSGNIDCSANSAACAQFRCCR